MCLKDTVANKFCVTESIQPVNTTDGSSPEDTILGLFLSASFLGTTCTECTKAQYQLQVKTGNSNFQPLTNICGANFTATLNSTVVGVTQAAVNSDFKAKNGAGKLAPTASLLLAVLQNTGSEEGWKRFGNEIDCCSSKLHSRTVGTLRETEKGKGQVQHTTNSRCHINTESHLNLPPTRVTVEKIGTIGVSAEIGNPASWARHRLVSTKSVQNTGEH
ncbi:hypothetical protein B0H17DRAFT_1136574 [Mycena rosella]|uniref:Uncharacterized protein n=1 Tax=Mycena rosella TaxID=1033263 RepID=A0AAD7GFU8_MYCRO|nr:hypothetical protein B0H17DRAFT_1136574 [Mycena rosella]